MAVVLGLDPGFSAIGAAVVNSHTMIPERLLLFETKKSDAKTNTLATSDNFRRTKEIYEFIDSLIVQYGPSLIVAESMSFPRNASVAAKMAYSWGVLAAVSARTKIPTLQVTPQSIKKKLTSKANASKEEMLEAVVSKYGFVLLNEAGLNDIAKGKWEHPVDALCAVVSAEDSEMFNLINKI